jgi:hypothetical protein
MLAAVFAGKLGMSLRHEVEGEGKWGWGLREMRMLEGVEYKSQQ